MQSHTNNIIITHQNNNHTKTTTTTTNNNNNNNNVTRGSLPQPRNHGPTTAQACAACKHRRSKCASDCILAPYFPHDRHTQFLNAHRLFGVSNITKIVRHLDPPEKDHAMRTIIFQSDARAADPVGGCYRIIRDLEQRISLARAELDIVLHHLALCRASAQQQLAGTPCAAEEEAVGMDDMSSWGCMMDGNVVVHARAESTSSSFPHGHRHNHDHDHHHGRKLSMEECNDDMIMPILDHFDVREEEFKFDSNGNIIPSNGGILTEEKDTFKEDDECFSYVQDHHDLKAAATFFSLTNCDI